MPPNNKKQEVQVVIEAPEQTVLNEALIAQAMTTISSSAKETEQLLASALGLSDSYLVTANDRDTVDFALELISFAQSSAMMSSRKALRFFNMMFELRDLIHRGDVNAAKQYLKMFAVCEIAAYNREAAIQTAIAEQHAQDAVYDPNAPAATPALGATTAAGGGATFLAGTSASAAASGGGTFASPARKEGGGGGGRRGHGNKQDQQDQNAAANHLPRVPAKELHFSQSDIGNVLDFAAFGLIQNWRLYHGAFIFSTENIEHLDSARIAGLTSMSSFGAENNNNNNSNTSTPVAAASSSSSSTSPNVSGSGANMMSMMETGSGVSPLSSPTAAAASVSQLQAMREEAESKAPNILLPMVPPARPPPLRTAKTLQEWEQDEAAKKAAVARELKQLQQNEKEALEAEAREREAKEAAQERQRQEEEAAKLFFERHGTDLAVQHVQKELQDEISARHASLIARMQKLEELYGHKLQL